MGSSRGGKRSVPGRPGAAAACVALAAATGCYSLPFNFPTPPANPYASYVPFIPMPSNGTYWQPVGPIVSAFPQPGAPGVPNPAPPPLRAVAPPPPELPPVSSASEVPAEPEPEPPAFQGKYGGS